VKTKLFFFKSWQNAVLESNFGGWSRDRKMLLLYPSMAPLQTSNGQGDATVLHKNRHPKIILQAEIQFGRLSLAKVSQFSSFLRKSPQEFCAFFIC